MSKFIVSLATLALMSLILMQSPIATATSQSKAIQGVWSYRWGPLPDYTKEDCKPGSGTVTITEHSIAFQGRFDGDKDDFTNSGSWAKVEDEQGHRAYDLKWSGSTDKVLLSSTGENFSGRSGKCYVRGVKQHSK